MTISMIIANRLIMTYQVVVIGNYYCRLVYSLRFRAVVFCIIYIKSYINPQSVGTEST